MTNKTATQTNSQPLNIHILGICGTFMGSLAQLAVAQGHRVSGSDSGVYPPMSDQLAQAGIALTEGFDSKHIPQDVDCVIIGNAMTRGNPSVEFVLDSGLPYQSGPQWLREHVLQNKWVLAVAGTHGKTTTASMLAWILEYAGMEPGFLIGGVPLNIGQSARLGGSPFFVIEADEYDTAFFDKRSKFVHYQPRTLVLNNLEFDHADIFPDLAAIECQFHHVVRTVPSSGQIVLPRSDEALARVLAQGCWSETTFLGAQTEAAEWQYHLTCSDGSEFEVKLAGRCVANVAWSLQGEHNVRNALAAIAAARHVGVKPDVASEALAEFQSVKRRMEHIGCERGVDVFDDFAHHPTAIASTLAGAKAHLASRSQGRLLAVIEPRSNTMKMGVHQSQLAESASCADGVFWYQPSEQGWSLVQALSNAPSSNKQQVFNTLDALVAGVVSDARAGDTVVVMSNGHFGGVHQLLLNELANSPE